MKLTQKELYHKQKLKMGQKHKAIKNIRTL